MFTSFFLNHIKKKKNPPWRWAPVWGQEARRHTYLCEERKHLSGWQNTSNCCCCQMPNLPSTEQASISLLHCCCLQGNSAVMWLCDDVDLLSPPLSLSHTLTLLSSPLANTVEIRGKCLLLKIPPLQPLNKKKKSTNVLSSPQQTSAQWTLQFLL